MSFAYRLCPDFPADASSVLTPEPGKQMKHLVKSLHSWARPCEIAEAPKTFCNGVESGDVIQGVLGDW